MTGQILTAAESEAQSARAAGWANSFIAFGIILSIYTAATLAFMIYANNVHLAVPPSTAATIDWGRPAVRGDIYDTMRAPTDVMKSTPEWPGLKKTIDDTGMDSK